MEEDVEQDDHIGFLFDDAAAKRWTTFEFKITNNIMVDIYNNEEEEPGALQVRSHPIIQR